MPLYGAPRSGSNTDPGKNLTAVAPGEGFTLFDGTETVALNLKSIAFVRAMSPTDEDSGSTFSVSNLAATTNVAIEGANEDIDTKYTVLDTLVPDANGNDASTDVGRLAFFRVRISAYTGGGIMPVVKVQR